MFDQLTEQDIQKMKEEVEYRKLVVRKEALEAVKEARAHGDLSENFEYHAAKKDKNANESRIRYLEKMIKTAVIVKDESQEDEVGLNNTVTVYFEDDKAEEKYKIVTSIRGNSLKGLINMESPMAKALMGHKVGERVYVKINETAGYYVQINHGDGFKSIYMHMTHYVVSKGEKVTQGQVIGYCGSTGASTGPHLHFGITKNGEYVNPANYIAI